MTITVLVDRKNYDLHKDTIREMVQQSDIIGIDTETHNRNAHEGIKMFRKENNMKAQDYRKIVITGLSIYPELKTEGDAVAYYFNLNHKDVENRLTWEEVLYILGAKKPEAQWIAHNAVYEITVLKAAYGFEFDNIICTLQMAVSAWGPDEYDKQDYINAEFGEMKTLFQEAERHFRNTEKDSKTPAQGELLSKVLGKSSHSSFSYNGVIQTIAYGYGLKPLVKKFFDYDMQTFEGVLGGLSDMGELTGPQVASYGAEDAYWAVKLFYKILDYMSEKCPETIPTFFSQENPMVKIFADIRLDGLKVNLDAIEKRRILERSNFANCLRELKNTAKALLPFPDEPNDRLFAYDKWYTTKYQEYRNRLQEWILSPNSPDDFQQVCQISSPVSNAWAGKKLPSLSLGHYFQSRLLMYDLTRSKAIVYKGKIQSDADSRGEMKEKFASLCTSDASGEELDRLKLCDTLLTKMGEIASIEQRMKLYLNPYSMLTDPETGRMYPEVSSMLATRRMASSNPNVMQLAKRGESTYVRGFYLPDEEDHVYISLDWSQIELVLIGEFSGDPEFAKAYGQLPYDDLHLGAAADVLGVVIEGVTPELLKNMHKMRLSNIPGGLLVKPNGEALTPEKAKKYWRTEVGKGSNFNYWYSGALSTVGDKLGWTSEQMWAATEAYRQRFSVAENWRVGLIEEAKLSGHVKLPDGHRRTRWEVTHEWATLTNRMFERYYDQGLIGVYKFGQQIMKSIRTRAGNQLVNAKIQGSSATLAKKSIIRIISKCQAEGIRANFKMPIHDELLFSVHKDDIIEFLRVARAIMTNHPEIISKLKIDCTASMGLTFEPFDKDRVPLGQIELDECPDILGFEEGSKLNDQQILQVRDYLFENRSKL